MVKLPISEAALKYYEEIGYKFSFKEQAHLCYRYTPGLLERNDALRKILKESDDKELNEDIKMLIDYGSNIYNMFMDNKDNKCVYCLSILTGGSRLDSAFGTIEGAKDYIRKYVHDDYKIDKIQLSDGCSIDDYNYRSTLVFKSGDTDEIVEYWSAEYEDNYDPYEHWPPEERFDNMFMNVDCPFERGDIVIRPEEYYPVIVLSDRNIFHDRYEAVQRQNLGKVIMILDYEDNLIPVLDCGNDFSIIYVRPFDLEKFDPRGHFSEQFCDKLFYASKMVKARLNVDSIKRYMEHRDD